MKKHDKFDPLGFNVDPELLAHDLTMLRLSKMAGLDNLNNDELYDKYMHILDEIEKLIEFKTIHDSGLSK